MNEDYRHLQGAADEAAARILVGILVIIMGLFGFFVFLSRGELMSALISLLLGIIMGVLGIWYWSRRASALERVMEREATRGLEILISTFRYLYWFIDRSHNLSLRLCRKPR